jgi:hypothetical protein
MPYKCKECASKVVPELFPDDDGKAAWWYHCQNPACGLFYGNPVYESDPEWSSKLDIGEPLDRWVDHELVWTTNGTRPRVDQMYLHRNYTWVFRF